MMPNVPFTVGQLRDALARFDDETLVVLEVDRVPYYWLEVTETKPIFLSGKHPSVGETYCTLNVNGKATD